MRIIHLSYSVPRPEYNDPEKWLTRISFVTGIFECESKFADVIAIYHINYKDSLRRNNVTYHFTKLKRWQLLFPFVFHRFVKKLKPDVVIVHGLIFPLQILLMRLQLGGDVKIIVQHHAERPFRDFRKYLQRWADRYIKEYFFASENSGEQWILDRQISDRKKINAVMGTSSIYYPVDKKSCRSLKGISQEEKIFLWIGGLDANKDPLTLVKAFRSFSKMYPDVRLFMIYQNTDLLDLIKAYIDSNFLTDCIKLIGKVDKPDLLHWYNSADFVVSTSHYEGSGIAVCEAMSCGCIPILTNIPSFRMMTNCGDFGVLFELGLEDSLLNAFIKGFGLDVELEAKKVLTFFNNSLSFEANANKILLVINK